MSFRTKTTSWSRDLVPRHLLLRRRLLNISDHHLNDNNNDNRRNNNSHNRIHNHHNDHNHNHNHDHTENFPRRLDLVCRPPRHRCGRIRHHNDQSQRDHNMTLFHHRHRPRDEFGLSTTMTTNTTVLMLGANFRMKTVTWWRTCRLDLAAR